MINSQIFHQLLYFPSERNASEILFYFILNSENNIISVELDPGTTI
jgi:hypothetical protein